jgi:hypothetical protein
VFNLCDVFQLCDLRVAVQHMCFVCTVQQLLDMQRRLRSVLPMRFVVRLQLM